MHPAAEFDQEPKEQNPLPGKDGWTIARDLEKDPKCSEIPIVIISALEPSKDIFNEFRMVKCILSKPIDPQDLLAKVNELLTP